MTNNVEGLWIVVPIHQEYWQGMIGEIYRGRPRYITKRKSLCNAIEKAKLSTDVIRVEVEEYSINEVKTYET